MHNISNLISLSILRIETELCVWIILPKVVEKGMWVSINFFRNTIVIRESRRVERTFLVCPGLTSGFFFLNLSPVEESGKPTTVTMAARRKQKEPPSCVYWRKGSLAPVVNWWLCLCPWDYKIGMDAKRLGKDSHALSKDITERTSAHREKPATTLSIFLHTEKYGKGLLSSTL